ncbi:hypothetical protein [Curtobacterium sp. MCLR17_034]|uniref:hypothetical protein n=1 Tax=Curtobacterium sp. MCLR17_034 TaxID=2175623 RepID=UPI000DA8FCEB|nr:hypothetical protein [Curtobacterium sp. MCLR17_034]PZF10429.1 hypothetical protein DEI98_09250 [Curtobacterium sp. MCLR17_034]
MTWARSDPAIRDELDLMRLTMVERTEGTSGRWLNERRLMKQAVDERRTVTADDELLRARPRQLIFDA